MLAWVEYSPALASPHSSFSSFLSLFLLIVECTTSNTPISLFFFLCFYCYCHCCLSLIATLQYESFFALRFTSAAFQTSRAGESLLPRRRHLLAVRESILKKERKKEKYEAVLSLKRLSPLFRDQQVEMSIKGKSREILSSFELYWEKLERYTSIHPSEFGRPKRVLTLLAFLGAEPACNCGKHAGPWCCKGIS